MRWWVTGEYASQKATSHRWCGKKTTLQGWWGKSFQETSQKTKVELPRSQAPTGPQTLFFMHSTYTFVGKTKHYLQGLKIGKTEQNLSNTLKKPHGKPTNRGDHCASLASWRFTKRCISGYPYVGVLLHGLFSIDFYIYIYIQVPALLMGSALLWPPLKHLQPMIWTNFDFLWGW